MTWRVEYFPLLSGLLQRAYDSAAMAPMFVQVAIGVVFGVIALFALYMLFLGAILLISFATGK